MTIRVVVADDQGMVRSGFSILLNAQPDIEVVGEAVNGQEAVARVAELGPDVVLMDVRMPVMDGLQATRQIAAMGDGAARVLVLTTFDLDDYVYEALRAGASGFLLKDASAGELAAAVRVVAAGDALLAPGVTRRLIAEFARLGAPRAASRKNIEDLTERETEVLGLVARGMSNAEIAAHLIVAEQTVKTHVSRVLMKLALRDRAQAVVFAYESGLVRAGEQRAPAVAPAVVSGGQRVRCCGCAGRRGYQRAQRWGPWSGAGSAGARVQVRIPVGTVAWEEIAFRGVLQAALRRVADEPAAGAVGAAVFGLWHIRPTAEALAVNGLATGRGARILAVTGVVAGTAGAGAVLSLLRERSGSLAAPVLLHLAANCAGPLASALARPAGRVAGRRR